jgi:hypothetical protein
LAQVGIRLPTGISPLSLGFHEFREVVENGLPALLLHFNRILRFGIEGDANRVWNEGKHRFSQGQIELAQQTLASKGWF